MSMWIFKRGKDGRRHLWLVDTPLGTLIPLLLLTTMAVFAAAQQYGSLFVAAGFSMLLVCKATLFQRGIWVSWGPRLLDKRFRRLYFVAYALMVLGIAGLIINAGAA